MALNSQNTFWGLFLGFELVSYFPRIIFKSLCWHKKLQVSMELAINMVNIEVFHGMLRQCCLTCKFSFLSCWKIYLLRRRYQKGQNLQNFKLKKLHSVFLLFFNPKRYISGNVIFASNRSKNSKIGCYLFLFIFIYINVLYI